MNIESIENVISIAESEARSIIANAKIDDLKSQAFEDKIYNSLKLDVPILDIAGTRQFIGTKVLAYNELPPEGVANKVGEPLHWLRILTPIKNSRYANLINTMFPKDQWKFIASDTVYYNAFSNEPFTTDIDDPIKKEAKVFFETIVKLFIDLKIKFDDFNDNVFKHSIRSMIEEELQRRSNHKNLEASFNPFL